MWTKNEAQKFLEQVEVYDAQIDCKMVERQKWDDLAHRITSQMGGERVQSSGSKHPMEDAKDKCMAAEEEACKAIDKLVDKMKRVTEVLEQMDNATQYKFLHMMYIQHMDMEDAAAKLNKSYDWAKTNHRRGLSIVRDILNRKENVSPSVTKIP